MSKIICLLSLYMCVGLFGFSQFGRDLYKAELISLSKRSEEKKNEFCFNILTPLITPSTVVGSGNVCFNPGLGTRVYQTNVGLVEANYNMNIFLTETSENPSYYATKNIDRTNYSLISNFSVLKRAQSKATHISIEGLSGGNYYTIVNAIHKQSLNLRAGITKSFSQSFSDTYSKLLWSTYPDFYPLTYGGNTSCWMEQYTKNYKLGISFIDYVNHGIEGLTNDNVAIKGRKGQLINCYFDVNYAYKSEASPVLYRYYAYGDPQSTSPFTNPMREETVDMKGLLKYKRLGFSLGVEKTSYVGKRNIRTFSTSLEIGSQTGYFDNIMRSLYLELKFICFGFGGLSKS